MDSILYKRARAVFLAAVDAPPGERERIVREGCADDSDLKIEVDSLLEADGRGGGATSAGVAPILETLEPSRDLIGRRIGRYHVVREIGSGGMGRVYEAVQESPRRAVALKVMRRLVATREVLRRFEFEVEFLARLRHPGIAEIYEAGTHRDGEEDVPWFAMELVPGARPLDVHAAEQHLDVPAKLRLFAEICDAVHYGHQRGVVHRDLKPGNVLIDADGRPRIIDFGVAKSTNSDVALTTLHTHVGELVGTLQYMSPEQCDADANAIDARSDVYSLGILLYELVCGRSPYDIAGKPLPAAARIVREHEPQRPSTIQRTLRGDIEAIVLKSIEKDPARRYSSAAALAEDLRRFLRGEPVEARSPSAWIVFARWVARHPVLTTTATCAAVVVLTLGSKFLGEQLLIRAPDRMSIDPDGRHARLLSRAGLTIFQWDAGADHSISFAQLVDRPGEFGGGRIAVIAANERATWPLGPELCVFSVDRPDRPVWTTAGQPVVQPPGEPDRPEARFCCGIVRLEDVFESSPGPELIVTHRLSLYSAQTVRIFDLSGRVRYQAWNDGALFDLKWLSGARRIVVAAIDSEKQWDEVGVVFKDSLARYPAVVFALEPRDGRVGENRWIVRGGKRGDETLAWYLWLGPAQDLGVLDDAVPKFSLWAGTLDPTRHANWTVEFWTGTPRIPKAGLHFALDGDGHVVTRHDDDAYKYWMREGLLPAPDHYQLLPYELLPR